MMQQQGQPMMMQQQGQPMMMQQQGQPMMMQQQGQPMMMQQGQPMMAQPMMAGPPQQMMVEQNLAGIMSGVEGIVVRQKLDIEEVFCPAFNKENKYKVGFYRKTDVGNDPSKWEDENFKKIIKHNKLFTLKENSECMDRYCCRHNRAFTMPIKASKKVTGTKKTVGQFNRPFKCTLYCGFCMLNPQEISTEDHNGKVIGRTFYDYRIGDACCNKRRWRITNGQDENPVYYLVDDQCCNANACAPSLCCTERKLNITDPSDQEVGFMINYFPGCNIKAFLGTADNYRMEFPKDASPEIKAQLVATAVLVDYQVFENAEEDDQAM